MTNLVALLHTTAAYQAAVLQMMVGEANFAAKQLQLNDRIPANTNGLNEWSVSPPPMGVGGSIVTIDFAYHFERGRLRSITKRDWLKKTGATNLLELAKRENRLDTNAAIAFATQALARLNFDLSALAQQPMHVIQVPVRKVDEHGRNLRGAENSLITPLFQISWGARPPPYDLRNPVRVKLLGTTPELVELRVEDSQFLHRPPLTVTNATELLGPFPSPRHFVESLFGGTAAYETVALPDRVEAWLLNSGFDLSERKLPETREGPVAVQTALRKRLSKALLDFDTYQWGVVKLCSPDYGLKLQFVRGTNTIDVRFCFECDILELAFNGKRRTENFDFNHNEFVSIAKKLFPKDQKIRSLEKEDEEKARRRFEEDMKQIISQ